MGIPMTRLPLISNSALNTFRRCPREYQYKYLRLRRIRSKAAALVFGSLFHSLLNAWWKTEGAPDAKLNAALDALSQQTNVVDPYELVKARVLIIGYTARWGASDPHVSISVEHEFRVPLCSAFDLGGAIDAYAQSPKGFFRLVEHKTTSKDITGGSDYWRHVTSLDPQVSTYTYAAKLLDLDPRDTLYDVIRKPTLVPSKATPEDKRRYTVPTAKNPTPRLYAQDRENDETPEEFGERLAKEIESNPDKYFRRAEIVRLERDEEEHIRDMLSTVAMIEHCSDRDWRTNGYGFPRAPTACERFGRLCEYHDVCSGTADIDDDSRFETKQRAHEELSNEL